MQIRKHYNIRNNNILQKDGATLVIFDSQGLMLS